jgi:hypothetical protein
MSSEDYEIFRQLKEVRREMRLRYGWPCPMCVELLPKANPTILLPTQRCKIHGYKDQRPKLTNEQLNELYAGHGIVRHKP